MKKEIVYFVFSLVTSVVFSQNLVPNPGFEEHILDSVFYWEQTAEPYYHFETNKPYAHSGNCINGICIWKSAPSEYLQVKLERPLAQGEKYLVRAYTMINSTITDRAFDTIKYLGIYFSKEKFLVSAKKILLFKPQVLLDVYGDSLWNKTESVYVAKGGESYMLLGHFYEYSNTLAIGNDSLNENVFREIENIDQEKSERIKSETSVIDEKYKNIKQDSWNIDKIKNKRKQEKKLKEYRKAMLIEQQEIQEMTQDVSEEFRERYAVLFSQFKLSAQGSSELTGFRLYFDDISVSPCVDTIPVEKIIDLKNVFFNSGKAGLLPASFTELDHQVNYLNENPEIIIEISGHTDNVGKESDNQLLSENRAKAVADYLIKKSIQPARVSYKGYGSTKPVSDNNSQEGRAKNRRVEIKIISE